MPRSDISKCNGDLPRMLASSVRSAMPARDARLWRGAGVSWGRVRQPCCWCDTASWPSPPGSDHRAGPVRCRGRFSNVEKEEAGGDHVNPMLIGRHTRQIPHGCPTYRFGAVEVSAEIGARRQTLSCARSAARADCGACLVTLRTLSLVRRNWGCLSERLSGAGAVPAVRAVRAPGWRRARRGGVGGVVRRCVALRRCCRGR
jgi:hypothetical protein